MAIKQYILKMYAKILKNLKPLSEIYEFDIYEIMDESYPTQFSYLVSCRKDNCFEVRKTLAQTMPNFESRTIFIISDSYESTTLLNIKKRKKLNWEKKCQEDLND